MRERIKLNVLLEATEHKRLKEYMRTDKPSHRKLYMEIYEFKDKTVINKLPTMKVNKTDCPKTIKIEYDCVTKDIIRVKLNDLERSLISFMRLNDYSVKFGKTKEVIEDVLHSGIFHTYGTVLPTLVHEAAERYFLIVERNGAIHGWIGISWRTLLSENNEVKAFGGDIVSIGVSNRVLPDSALEEVHKIIRTIPTNVMFKEMATLRLPKKYGDIFLVRHEGNWVRYVCGITRTVNAGSDTRSDVLSWIPRETFEKLLSTGNDGVRTFYSSPPLKTFNTVGTQTEWLRSFCESYKRGWSESHTVEMSAVELAQMGDNANAELDRLQRLNGRLIQDWANTTYAMLREYGVELAQMSASATILGLNRHHGGHSEGANDDNEGSCSVGCDEFGTEYCSTSCSGDPCDNCGEDCGNCSRSNNQ